MSEGDKLQRSLFDDVISSVPSHWDEIARVRHDILSGIATREWLRLANEVVSQVRGLPESALQSGHDSDYLDVWEEYCAHVQGDKSFVSDLYLHQVERACSAVLDQPEPIKALLWLFSKSFSDFGWGGDVGSAVPHVEFVESDLVRELCDRVRKMADDEELQTINERLLSIAPYRDTMIGLMGDPGVFMGNMFADASDYVLADPSEYRQMAERIAPDTLEDLIADGVVIDILADREDYEYIAEQLERFFQAWRAAARAKFGLKLKL